MPKGWKSSDVEDAKLAARSSSQFREENAEFTVATLSNPLACLRIVFTFNLGQVLTPIDRFLMICLVGERRAVATPTQDLIDASGEGGPGVL
jgi:hypothetical protein